MENKELPAFPVKGSDGRIMTFNDEADRHWIDQLKPAIGLTKREYFAAMAAQGLATDWDRDNDDIAINAVKIADALLKELSKPQP